MLIKWKNKINILWTSLKAPHNAPSAHQSSTWLPKPCAPPSGQLLPNSSHFCPRSLSHSRPSMKVTSPISTCQHPNLYSRPNSATPFYTMGLPILQEGTRHSSFWIPQALCSYLCCSISHMDYNGLKRSFSVIRGWAFEGSSHACLHPYLQRLRYAWHTAGLNDCWTHGELVGQTEHSRRKLHESVLEVLWLS